MKYELLKEAEGKNLEEILEIAKTVEIANGKASDVENRQETINTAEDKETGMHHVNTSRNGQYPKQQYFDGRRNGNFQQRRPNFKNGNFSRGQQQQGSNAQANVNNFCKCCGKGNHLIFQCSLRFKYCSECGIQGHVFRMCPSRNNDFRPSQRVNTLETEQIENSSSGDTSDNNNNNTNSSFNDDVEVQARYNHDDYHFVHEIKIENEIVEPARVNKVIEPQFEIIKVNNIPLKMEIDSGSPISAVSFDCYKKNFSMLPILRAYNNQQIPAKGKIMVEIQRNNNNNDTRWIPDFR
ncbi:uncharacterized protein LOC116738655 [Nasonia vitripennis]|uniref:CCHC-type domain-containing protein n=1 Tax=Nasonia vitripennis TaxID=7425 RepID=A0A7M7TEH2_NASVI|nr:uncharacterized protein LOC116738655 [Nasonia vitripennis]